MTTTINASTSAGLVQTADTSGSLALQTASTTALSISASQVVTLTNALPVASGGTGGTTSTGSGAVVLGTSPTITTPVISSLSSASATALTLQSAGTTAVTIDTSQNVGIGTGSPSSKLHVAGASGNGLTISGSGATGVFRPSSAGVELGSSSGDNTVFLSGSSTERMRITSAGNVGVGTSSPGYKFHVVQTIDNFACGLTNSSASTPYGQTIIYSGSAPANTDYGFLYCSDTSNQKLVIYSSGTISNRTGTYNALSDIKIKQDISDASSQWDDIKAVKFRKYRLIDDVKANADAPYFLGVVAQELEETSPNLIDEAPDTVNKEDGTIEYLGTSTKQVKYSILYMKAVKALQEAMARIETLEAKADTQAETINALTARLVALEAK
jgi:hypothetical protein